MSPEAQALKQELDMFVEKMRADKDYRYTPRGLKEFIDIKSKYGQSAMDELLSHIQGGEHV